MKLHPCLSFCFLKNLPSHARYSLYLSSLLSFSSSSSSRSSGSGDGSRPAVEFFGIFLLAWRKKEIWSSSFISSWSSLFLVWSHHKKRGKEKRKETWEQHRKRKRQTEKTCREKDIIFPAWTSRMKKVYIYIKTGSFLLSDLHILRKKQDTWQR